MRPSDCLKVGWQALRVNTGRSLLTTLGVVVGVAAVICTMSIGAGAEDEVAETLRTLGANLLSVTPGAANARGVRMEAGGRRNLTEGDAAAIRRELPEIQIAAPLVSKRLQVIAGSRNWSTLVAGVTPDYLDAREWSAAEGRLFDSDDLDSGAKVAIVGSNVANALFDDQAGRRRDDSDRQGSGDDHRGAFPEGRWRRRAQPGRRRVRSSLDGEEPAPRHGEHRDARLPRPHFRQGGGLCRAAGGEEPDRDIAAHTGIACGATRQTTFRSKTPPTSSMPGPARPVRSPGCSWAPPRSPWRSAASAS